MSNQFSICFGNASRRTNRFVAVAVDGKAKVYGRMNRGEGQDK